MKQNDPLIPLIQNILDESRALDENADVEAIKKVLATLKVGDETNFGKVLDIGPDWIEVKTSGTPKTSMDVKTRVIGRKERVLSKLVKR